jgi:ketosteroid isomerase-like protein
MTTGHASTWRAWPCRLGCGSRRRREERWTWPRCRPGRHVGADAVLRDVFAGFREEWEGWRAVVERYLDAGESAVALGRYEGTYKPTNRPVRAEFAHLYELEDGRIRRFIWYTDTLLLAEAMDRSPTTSGERTGSLRRGS